MAEAVSIKFSTTNCVRCSVLEDGEATSSPTPRDSGQRPRSSPSIQEGQRSSWVR